MGVDRVVLPAYTVGPNAYDQVAGVVLPHGNRLFLCGGETALVKGRQALADALQGTDVALVDTRLYGSDCTRAAAEATAHAARTAGADVLAGMGGGRALDTAKAAAKLLHLPVITLPTIAATCAAVSALSVMYRDDGTFSHFERFDAPPLHAFLHTGILAGAPAKYLRAGMGDSTAKHVESTFSARGRAVNHRNALGLACSASCFQPLMDIGAAALEDNARGADSDAFRDAVLANIVSTGIVSILVDEGYNGALAHSLYYALEELPEIAHNCLHGEVVAWGVLVQLTLDGQTERAAAYAAFLDRLRIPRTLGIMGVPLTHPALQGALHKALSQPDMDITPYRITPDMLKAAIAAVETMPGTA